MPACLAHRISKSYGGRPVVRDFSTRIEDAWQNRDLSARRYVYVWAEGSTCSISSPAPVASGWSGCRVGLAPTGKRRLVTAHTRSRRHADTADPRSWTTWPSGAVRISIEGFPRVQRMPNICVGSELI